MGHKPRTAELGRTGLNPHLGVTRNMQPECDCWPKTNSQIAPFEHAPAVTLIAIKILVVSFSGQDNRHTPACKPADHDHSRLVGALLRHRAAGVIGVHRHLSGVHHGVLRRAVPVRTGHAHACMCTWCARACCSGASRARAWHAHVHAS